MYPALSALVSGAVMYALGSSRANSNSKEPKTSVSVSVQQPELKQKEIPKDTFTPDSINPVLKAVKRKEALKEKVDSKASINIYKLEPKQFLNIYLKEKNIQLQVLKKIANDDSFSFKNFVEEDIRKFVDILHFQKKLKNSTYEIILHKLMENPLGLEYIKDLKEGMAEGILSMPANFLPIFLDTCSYTDKINILKGQLTKIPRLQLQKYQELHKRNIPYLLLES